MIDTLSAPQYKQQLESLRAKVVEDMDTVKRRDHLEFVEVDPSVSDLSLIYSQDSDETSQAGITHQHP